MILPGRAVHPGSGDPLSLRRGADMLRWLKEPKERGAMTVPAERSALGPTHVARPAPAVVVGRR